MIPLAWLEVLKAVPWKWLAWALAGLAVAAFAWRVTVWWAGYVRLATVTAEAEDAAREYESRLARMEQNWRAAQAASRGYLDELEQIRSRPLPESRVIRVCKPARRVPAPGTAARGPDGPAAETGSVSESVAFDTGPVLLVGDRCDEVSARLRALQAWAVTVTDPSPDLRREQLVHAFGVE
jgi:hypothetical protein